MFGRLGLHARAPWARWVALALAALVAAPLAGTARGSIPIVETDDVTWTFGGYVRALSGVQVPGVRGLPGAPDALGVSQALARLEWKWTFGDVAALELHNRLALTVMSAEVGGGGLGIGVTPTPQRSVDLRSTLVEEAGLLLEHDVDRLALRLFLGDVDVAVGRQAITWGISSLFAVSDAWAAFSPFDLDTSQKRGVDAVRVGTPLSDELELDLVVADRGSAEDLSAGARLVAYLGGADVHVGLAKLWRELVVMAGVSVPVDAVKLRAEARWGAWDLAREEVLRPRATLGVDGFWGDLTLTVEAHYNGAGAASQRDYGQHAATSPELARGEVFLLGRYYAGAAASYQLTEQLTVTVSALVNLGDPSALIVTSLRYDIAENVDLRLGAFTGVGARTDLASSDLGSELGTYGHLVHLDLAAWF